MVDLQTCACTAGGAASVLSFVNGSDVCSGKRSSVPAFCGSSIGGGYATNLFSYFWIGILPALYFRTVASWVFGSASSRSCGHVARVGFIPFGRSNERAFDADTIRDKMPIFVAVLAGFTNRIMSLTCFASCNAARMFGFLLLPPNLFLDGTSGTNAISRVSLRKMTIFARLASMVETLAFGFGGFSFWNSVHRPPLRLSSTFTVAQAA